MRFSFDYIALSVIFCGALCADSSPPDSAIEPLKAGEPFPWLTGPLLTPSGHVIPNGHVNIEPYEYLTTNFGAYDHTWHTHPAEHNFYNFSTQVQIQIGLPADFDVVFTPQWAWRHTTGTAHWVLNDMPFGFDYQLVNDRQGEWWPAVKLNVSGNLPIGKYQKLREDAKGTDLGGSGSWVPNCGFVLSHTYWWGGPFFFAPRFNVQYAIPTPVHVKGFNAYGGGHHTHGKVYPGQSLLILFGFEISLSQRFAIACDIDYLHTNKTRFKGERGMTEGAPNRIGGPSSESLGIAPALEYNWNENYGVIAGVWFSIAGRNTTEFASGVIALNIYH